MKKLTFLALGGMTVLGAYACSGDETSELTSSGGSGPAQTSGNGQGGNGAGGDSVGSFVGSGGMGGNLQGSGGNCNDFTADPQTDTVPADIIFVIDNSGSMSEEIAAVEQNINVNFAQIMANASIDYQVIMVTNHGTGYVSPSYLVCIGPPLSGTTNCNAAPVNMPNQFQHYDVDVQSWDSACIMLETLYASTSKPDQWGQHPNGWSAYLRPNAKKFIIEITDDRMSCTWNGSSMNDSTINTQYPQPGQQAAVEFDKVLLQLAPGQFGTTANRNYIFYSIVGVEPNPQNPTLPYDENHPYISTKCTSAVNSGPGYQWLSKGTGGWRFPVCNVQDYGPIFQKIAEDVIVTTSVGCEFDLPDPPTGFTYNLDTVEMLYTPDGSSSPQVFQQVPSSAACNVDTDKFYIENNKIYLCPGACNLVQSNSNPDAKVEVNIKCGFIPE